MRLDKNAIDQSTQTKKHRKQQCSIFIKLSTDSTYVSLKLN